MVRLSVGHGEGQDAFLGQLDRFVSVSGGLTDHEMLAASRCWGWTVLDVIVHVRAGLQEMLGGAVSRCSDRPDTDAASYWTAPLPTADSGAEVIDGLLWTRRTASAYRRPTSAAAHLRHVAGALTVAVRDLPDGAVRFQGHVLTSGDFLATWAVELAVHHLDITVELDLAPARESALKLARSTIEALLGATVPHDLDDASTVLIGTGRRVANRDEAQLLGEAATRLPVLG